MYEPPFTRTPEIDNLCMQIAEMTGAVSPASEVASNPMLHRRLRIKTIHSSLAIEGNDLTEDEVFAVLDGKRVLGSEKDIREVQNAARAYDLASQLDPTSIDDLLHAHKVMMDGLVTHPGTFRSKNVGVYDGGVLIHAGTPARYVSSVMLDLFEWLSSTDMHPLLRSCVFHSEFEFIHPFEDGNGRVGRLWHTLLLAAWRPVLARIPIEEVILKRQQDYYAALQASDNQGDAQPFVTYMLRAIREALEPYCRTATVKQTREERVLVLMREKPGVTMAEIAVSLDVSKSTAERLVDQMKAAGLISRTGNRRSGSWVVNS